MRYLLALPVAGLMMLGTAGVAYAEPVHCYPLSVACELQVGPFQFDVPINFDSLFPSQP